MHRNTNNPSISSKKQVKKAKDTVFKPELNQPTIKNIIPKTTRPKSTSAITQVQKGYSDLPAPKVKQNDIKKQSPPTPPEHEVSSKRLNMNQDIDKDTDKQLVTGDNRNEDQMDTGDNGPKQDDGKGEIDQEKGASGKKEDQNQDEPELSPELQCLRELIRGDMERLMIKPLLDRMTKLEESHEKLELKGESINIIKQENKKLRQDCDYVMKENEVLKNRLDTIETRLQSSNVIIHGIEDQVWEINEVTREKVLLAISNTAPGNTPQEKLDAARMIGFRDIRRIGDYKTNRKCPILLEFEKQSSANHLLQHKKKLPRGIFADKEYSIDVERERRKLRPILRRAKQLMEYKTKSKMEGDRLIIKGKSYTSKNLHQLPQPLNGYNVSSKEGDNHIGFFGELNPLSNFHVAPFVLDGITFHSSEQFIQYQKAKLFEDDDTANKISTCKTPLECKEALQGNCQL